MNTKNHYYLFGTLGVFLVLSIPVLGDLITNTTGRKSGGPGGLNPISVIVTDNRIWTEIDTGRKLEGILQSKSPDGGEVKVKRKDGGEVVTLKTDRLVKEDREFIKSWKSAGTSPPIPSAIKGKIPPDLSKFGGMSLDPNWMPNKTDGSKVLYKSLAFYTRMALRDTPRGKETVPKTILGPLTWLMPMEEALKTLPPNVNRIPERKITQHGFPEHSLYISGYQHRYFSDDGLRFNQMFLIWDLQHRLVGVQLVAQNEGYRSSAGGANWNTGTLNPYFDFLNLKANAVAGRPVWYGVSSRGPGVTLVWTSCKDDVRWYLTAPLARCILDIAEAAGLEK